MHRLVPPHIDALAQSGRSHHVSAGATLIIDAAGSTALSELLQAYGTEGAEALANILSAIFAPMVERVTSQGGLVAEIAGDGVLALFPGATDEAVTRAVSAAIEIVEDLHATSEFETPAGPASRRCSGCD
jgi:class 3 adenylate cyclase